MSILLIIIGILIAVAGYASAFGAIAQGAMQQTVQALWALHGTLGLVLVALGMIALGMGHVTERLQTEMRTRQEADRERRSAEKQAAE